LVMIRIGFRLLQVNGKQAGQAIRLLRQGWLAIHNSLRMGAVATGIPSAHAAGEIVWVGIEHRGNEARLP
jgi:hypothetical protein